MDHKVTASSNEPVLHAALELSKNNWLLALQFPDRTQPSLYRLGGGDTEALMAKLMVARDRMARISGTTPSVMLCYEVGYDGIWLARFLKARGVECLVVDGSSIRVDRRARRAKTDRLDAGMLLRSLIAWSKLAGSEGGCHRASQDLAKPVCRTKIERPHTCRIVYAWNRLASRKQAAGYKLMCSWHAA
jgi:hypothetical protein